MTSSPHGLYVQGYTRATLAGTEGCDTARWSESQKAGLGSDWRLKLKGIDGGPHKRWSMWFNSTQREEPYLGLTCTRPTVKIVFSSERVHRCCMAVVSSCREMLG